MTADAPAYCLWPLVVINAAILILFAFSFVRPRTKRDWRLLGDEYGRYVRRTPAFVPRLATLRLLAR